MSGSTDLPDEFLQKFANLSLSSRRRVERPYPKPIFAELPTELLQQIAGYCQASDILALSQTCRRLNKACDMTLIFEMSFKNHLPALNTTAFQNKTALVKFVNNYVKSPNKFDHGLKDRRMMWTCMALAASRIPHAWSEIKEIAKALTCKGWVLNKDTIMSLQGPLGFLATLPIWGYTKQLNRVIDLDHVFASLENQVGEHFHETLLQLAFLSAIRTLEMHTTLHRHTMLLDCATSYREALFSRETTDKMWTIRSKWALLIAERMARLIRHESVHDGTFYSDPATGECVRVKVPHYLPNPRKIEFLDFSQFEEGKKAEHTQNKRHMPSQPTFPLLTPKLVAQKGGVGRYFDVFCGGEWSSWHSTRVQELLTNIDKGEWCCTYIKITSDGCLAEATLTGIHFRKIPDGGKFIKYMIRLPDGKFPREASRLRGLARVTPEIYKITIVNRAWDGVTHSMNGSFTPLGISGIDVRRHGSSIVTGGLFWLWKRDWVDAVAC
ncbi:hypothetical protein F5B19DRAFT_495206 [Rostrohypoxylon terebratum]|nr:hypothetical protein F5B19DRAFT_495206 [Rostrohypoxylon terebratum]